MDKHYALWVDQHGRRCWEGPFDSAGRAWGSMQRTLGVTRAMVICGTQLSNTIPSLPPATAEVNEFTGAKPADGRGPWFRASYPGDCNGECGGQIYEGDEIRADGKGGWLCSICGAPEIWLRE